MKVRNSLRSLKNRHRDCRVVRRKGRVYVINKTQRRFKARQLIASAALQKKPPNGRLFLCLRSGMSQLQLCLQTQKGPGCPSPIREETVNSLSRRRAGRR